MRTSGMRMTKTKTKMRCADDESLSASRPLTILVGGRLKTEAGDGRVQAELDATRCTAPHIFQLCL